MNALRRIAVSSCVLALIASVASAQGRGGGIWTTAGGDSARSASMRSDVRISRESLSKPGFQLLWKRTLETRPRNSLALTQPVFSAPGFITYKGFKGIAYLGGVSDTVYAVDYDLNRMFWTTKLTTASTTAATAACPGGVTAVTETSQLPPSPAPAASQSEGGRGAGGGGFGVGGGRGAVAGLYVVSSGGMLHNLNLQTGTDWFTPARMLPGSNAKVTGSILVNSVMYVTTTGNCGGVANAVYAMDLTPPDPPQPGPNGLPVAPNAVPLSTEVKRWESGAGVVGGPAFTSDGMLYVTTGAAAGSTAGRPNAVVALESKTLGEKDYFLAPGPFTTAPVTFSSNGKEFVAAGNGNRVYLFDAGSLGASDHKTAVATSPVPENRLVFGATTAPAPEFAIVGLATFEDTGTRWLVATARPSFTGTSVSTGAGAVFGYKVSSQNGAVLLTQAWVTQVAFPVTPAVANGVVFALTSSPLTSAGGARTVLHALDASTGKELWNSGTTITSPASDIGPAVDDGQVYVVTTDGTLWTFGFVVER